MVDWYGATPADQQPLRETASFVTGHGLASILRLHPPIHEVELEYRRADAVGLFSEYEGLPNVVCEGMACGKPIIMSDVCDARHLVADGENGFVCNPHSPPSIASAINRMATLNSAARLQMGLESRRRAERLFKEDAVLDRYERILESAARRLPLPADCSWPPEVLGSAAGMGVGGRSVRHSPRQLLARTALERWQEQSLSPNDQPRTR